MVDLKNTGHYLIFLLLTYGYLFSISIDIVSSSNVESIEQYSETLEDDKAQDMEKRPSFFVGSRYGRSGTGTVQSKPSISPKWISSSTTLKSRRLNVMPRNDKFFLGSRYGKRNDNNLEEEEAAEDEERLHVDSMPFTNYEHNAFPVHLNYDKTTRIYDNNLPTPLNVITIMKCVYTGLINYYRCNALKSIPSSDNHSLRYDNTNNSNDHYDISQA